MAKHAVRPPVWLRVAAGRFSIPGPALAPMDIHVTDVMRGSIAADTTAPPTTPGLPWAALPDRRTPALPVARAPIPTPRVAVTIRDHGNTIGAGAAPGPTSSYTLLRSRPCAVTAQITNTSKAMISNAHHG